MLTRQNLQTIYQRKTKIRQKLSIPEKTLERYIKILRDAGLIEYKGSKKTGGYYIVHDRDASNEGITEGINRGINEGINELYLSSNYGRNLLVFGNRETNSFFHRIASIHLEKLPVR